MLLCSDVVKDLGFENKDLGLEDIWLEDKDLGFEDKDFPRGQQHCYYACGLVYVQSGWSALHTAAWNGYADLCSVLLKSGADPDICGPSAVTPLCLASQQGHSDVVRILIEADCNVHCSADIDGSQSVTALHLAARNGHTDVVRLLVAARADIEAPMTARDIRGVTALHLAVESGHLDIIDVLLDAGSNVNRGTLCTRESAC